MNEVTDSICLHFHGKGERDDHIEKGREGENDTDAFYGVPVLYFSDIGFLV